MLPTTPEIPPQKPPAETPVLPFPDLFPVDLKLIVAKYHAMDLNNKTLRELADERWPLQAAYLEEFKNRLIPYRDRAKKVHQALPQRYKHLLSLLDLAAFHYSYPERNLISAMQQHKHRTDVEFTLIAKAYCLMLGDYLSSKPLPSFHKRLQNKLYHSMKTHYLLIFCFYACFFLELYLLNPYREPNERDWLNQSVALLVFLYGSLYHQASYFAFSATLEQQEDFLLNQFNEVITTEAEYEYEALCQAIFDPNSPLGGETSLAFRWNQEEREERQANFSAVALLSLPLLLGYFLISPCLSLMFQADDVYEKKFKDSNQPFTLSTLFADLEALCASVVRMAIFFASYEFTFDIENIDPILNKVNLPETYLRACLASSLWCILSLLIEKGYLLIEANVPSVQATLRTLRFSPPPVVEQEELLEDHDDPYDEQDPEAPAVRDNSPG